jgi:uncharacterized protein
MTELERTGRTPRFTDVLQGSLYCIQISENRHILYAPLHGLALLVNDTYRRTLVASLKDSEALNILGVETRILKELTSMPPQAEKLIPSSWTQEFRPNSLTLFLTHKCTLRCRYCYCFGGRGKTMPLTLTQKAINIAAKNAADMGKQTFNLSFHGGDVGACWDLFTRTVSYTQERCVKLGLKTSISLGTNAFYTEQQASYIAHNMNNATVSLDGAPDCHDRYRCRSDGSPSSPEILRTLSIFDSCGFSYAIRMTVLADTVEQLPENVEFICTHSQAKQIRAEPMYLRGRAALADSVLRPPPPEQFVTQFKRARKIAQDYDRVLSYSGVRLGRIECTFCSHTEPTFGVTPEGNLTSCYEVLQPSDFLWDHFTYGQIDSKTGEMHIQHDSIRKIREAAVQKRENCRDCFCYTNCAGDCAAKATNLLEDDGAIPDRCHITRSLTIDELQTLLEKGGQMKGNHGQGEGRVIQVVEPEKSTTGKN